jgi:hypothetical protein
VTAVARIGRVVLGSAAPTVSLLKLGLCLRSPIFSHCGIEQKRGRIRRVKYWQAILAIFAALSASFALAEDFRTINGKEYKNATVSRVEADGIVLKMESGIAKVYFTELPRDVQERFHYGSATPTGKAVTQRIVHTILYAKAASQWE